MAVCPAPATRNKLTYMFECVYVSVCAAAAAAVRFAARGGDIGAVLKLCDEVRDSTLPKLGVRLEDAGDKSVWKLVSQGAFVLPPSACGRRVATLLSHLVSHLVCLRCAEEIAAEQAAAAEEAERKAKVRVCSARSQ